MMQALFQLRSLKPDTQHELIDTLQIKLKKYFYKLEAFFYSPTLGTVEYDLS